GIVMLTLSASLPQLRPPKCPETDRCPSPSPSRLAPLYFSMALLIAGAAGIRPCSLLFGVDQFDRSTRHGRQSLNSFYNWYYFSSCLALFFSMTFLVYIQNSISWPIGFGIPAALMLLAVILFFLGTPLYTHVVPQGSIFSGIAQVFVAAFRKRRLRLSSTALLHNPPPRHGLITKLPLTPKFRFLNNAAIELPGEVRIEDGSCARPWRLCSVQQIEEVKCLISITPIWISGVLFFTVLSQQWTFIVLQSMKMDRHIGPRFAIPPAAVSPFNLLALSIFLPIYDRILVPFLRRVTKLEQGITLLQRQGTGLLLSVLSMVLAGLVEWRRRERKTMMSVLWLSPQLTVMGVSEAFNYVGQIEFYNREFPEHLLTMGGSLVFLCLAGASYLSLFLVSVVRKVTGGEGRRSWLEDDLDQGRLDYYYYLIAVLGMLNFLYFLVCAKFYQYKGAMAEGEEDGEEGGEA
ncbi:protein NRT1/ PTR FAMILY 2.13-like, partial [Phalaenopsis equestris]|uniref:protein NRT1/ PTR FAMILY 2.13-like n=1 Tax=Phalaenopsis equestris TaxID=78828 RepID=UPI0009E641C5